MKQIGKLSNLIGGDAKKDVHVLVLADRSADAAVLAYAREQLLPQTENVHVNVIAYSDTRPKLSRDADLTLIIAGSSAHTSTLIGYAHEFELPWAALVCDIASATAGLATDDADQAEELAKNIIVVPANTSPVEVFVQLADCLASCLPKTRLALGRAWPFLRPKVAQEIVRSTSFQNAVCAAAFFIPGADMPVLTANQCRMLLQLAQLHGLELGTERLKEVAVLIAGAFGARALARALVARLSLLAVPLRAGMAWSATYAIGQAGIAFYAQGGDTALLGNQLADGAKDSFAKRAIALRSLPSRLPVIGSRLRDRTGE